MSDVFGRLAKAVIRDNDPAPHDMVYIASEYLNGNEHDMEMVEEAFRILAPGLYSPSKSKEELFSGLCVALNV